MASEQMHDYIDEYNRKLKAAKEAEARRKTIFGWLMWYFGWSK